MWELLSQLPAMLIHMALVIGVLGLVTGFLLGFIPFVNAYKVPIQVISILLVAVGLWFEGSLSKEKEWKLKEAQWREKIRVAQIESGKVDIQIVTEVITNRQIIREKGDVIVEYIREIIEKDPAPCPVPEPYVLGHNAAATNNPELLQQELPSTEHNSLIKDTK